MAQYNLDASNTNATNQGAKLAYQRPSLTVYGSVRELTGGGSGTNSDTNKLSPNPGPINLNPPT